MRAWILSALLLSLGCADSCARGPGGPNVGSSPAPAARPLPSASQARSPAPPQQDAAAETATPRFLKGQTHVHTARSYDANTEPDRVLSFYAERGYDFVALTDHNRVTVVEPPGKLLLVPGVELTQNSTVCEPKPVSGYRCLFHTTALFVDPARDSAKGARMRMPFVEQRRRAFLAQMGHSQRMGGIAVLNHPAFHFAADARTIVSLTRDGLKLVELFNAGLDQQHPDGRAAAERRAEILWDDVLSQGALIYGLATDDAHHFDDAVERARMGKFAYTGDRAWIMVRAEAKPEKIRQALLEGSFYASTGVRILRLERSVRELVLELAPESATARIRFVGRGGRTLAESRGPEARYVLTGKEGYVRAVAEMDSGEKAWVQPVMVSRP